jgi:hypothetical protein
MQEKSAKNLKKVGVPGEIRYGNLIIQVRVVTTLSNLFVKTVGTLTCMIHVINKLIT